MCVETKNRTTCITLERYESEQRKRLTLVVASGSTINAFATDPNDTDIENTYASCKKPRAISVFYLQQKRSNRSDFVLRMISTGRLNKPFICIH